MFVAETTENMRAVPPDQALRILRKIRGNVAAQPNIVT